MWLITTLVLLLFVVGAVLLYLDGGADDDGFNDF